MLTWLALIRHFLIALGTVACIAPAHAVLLTVVKSGSGEGTVSSTPGGINCGASCSAEFSNGAAVFLTATASPGSTFSGWSGGGCSTVSGCLVLLSSSPQTITATFSLIPTLQSALDNPALTWTTSGNAPWAGQSQVFVLGGSAARSGTIGNGQASSLSTTVTGPVIVDYLWKVSSQANSDFLTLFLNGAPLGEGISGEVDWNRQVINLPAGIHQLEWRYSKDGSGAGGQDAAWLDFTQLNYPLTVSKSGAGSGLVTSSPAGIICGAICSLLWNSDTQVTLTAAAAAGSIFTGWSGGTCSGTTSPTCTMSMSTARSVTASFVPDPGPAVDNTALSWRATGNVGWAPQSQVFFTGGSAARSGTIGNGQVSTIATTVTGPGIVSFWWKVSSQTSFDILTFFINGLEQSGRISGEVDWNYQVFNLPAGIHQLEWRYVKDGSFSVGQDAAWLDAVTFTRNPRDFSADGRSDLLWQNTSTGDRFVWFMNGAVFSGATSLGVVSTDWSMAGSADFNGDGQSDILWQNTVTGDRFIWFMNGAAYSGGVSLGAVPTAWSIAGTGDFNGDGKPDILWQNTVTGDRLVWFMNGATYTGAASLGTVPTDWSIAGTGDYNTDGRPDILWQNTATGERVLWFMNGASYTGAASLGIVPTDWSIVGTGDFNGDARPDIVWQNNASGDRLVWFMNGTAFTGAAFLGSVPPAWRLVR